MMNELFDTVFQICLSGRNAVLVNRDGDIGLMSVPAFSVFDGVIDGILAGSMGMTVDMVIGTGRWEFEAAPRDDFMEGFNDSPEEYQNGFMFALENSPSQEQHKILKMTR